MLKVGLIGCGFMGGMHSACYNEIDGVQVVAVADVRPEKAEEVAKLHGAKIFANGDELIANADVDVVDICLPTYLHADYAIMAMEKGINVICEKPISLKEEDIERVYSTAKKNNVKFMIAQVLRFWPEYELLKEIFDTEKYGKLLSGTMTRLGCYPKWSWDGWMMDEKRSGLTPFDLHIHDLDFMVYAFGAPKKVAHQYRSKRPDQDFISVTYDFGDFSINSEASWYATSYPFTAEFRFQFEDALVSNENGKMQIFLRDGKIDLSEDAEGDTGDINLPKSDAYANEIKYFLDCVMNDKEVEKVKSDELLAVLKILNSL
jgi:predicted dehydrogenase